MRDRAEYHRNEVYVGETWINKINEITGVEDKGEGDRDRNPEERHV